MNARIDNVHTTTIETPHIKKKSLEQEKKITFFAKLRLTKSNRIYIQGCKSHYKKFSENAGVQGPHRPWWGQGATALVGGPRGQRPLGETEFSHFYSLKIGLS